MEQPPSSTSEQGSEGSKLKDGKSVGEEEGDWDGLMLEEGNKDGHCELVGEEEEGDWDNDGNFEVEGCGNILGDVVGMLCCEHIGLQQWHATSQQLSESILQKENEIDPDNSLL